MPNCEKEGYESSTISRNIASIRSFFLYLFKRGMIRKDPAENLKAPKVEKKMPEILTVEEVDRLLRQPNPETYKGMRDKAMASLFMLQECGSANFWRLSRRSESELWICDLP